MSFVLTGRHSAPGSPLPSSGEGVNSSQHNLVILVAMRGYAQGSDVVLFGLGEVVPKA